jgi:molybdopterin biosynthesis enzyme
MVLPLEHRQRIRRLTPLEDVVRRIAESVHPVTPRDMRAAAALGATLAQDVAVAAPQPATPLALIDGWAVRSELTADAGAYTPTVLPGLREIAVGEALRADNDAVAPLEAVTWSGDKGKIHVPVPPGEGVLMPGTDADRGEVLRQANHRLRAIDVATMQAFGINDARVRKPRIRVARTGGSHNVIAAAIADWLAYAITADGGEPVAIGPGDDVEALLIGGGVDAVAIIGGTGSGARDDTVHALRRRGAVEVHGIAVSPGETTAFGVADSRPVLLMPGRLDAAMTAWLLIGREMLTRLSGSTESLSLYKSTLIGKIASTIGLTELVLVRRVADGVTPLALKYLPLAALAQADGWIAIPAASEGLAAGTPVIVRPLP